MIMRSMKIRYAINVHKDRNRWIDELNTTDNEMHEKIKSVSGKIVQALDITAER